MDSFRYPPPPAHANDDIIRPSEQFRKEVGKVVLAIGAFVMIYMLLLIFSLLIALSCLTIAWIMISGIRNWMGIVFGLGMAGVGMMVTFFVFKFLFARRQADNAGRLEITEIEYPELFSFIRQIAQETDVPFPKRIYLSPEVNAAVFYDSSFWSMILPVRKNLVLGLGLINMVNLSEAKSVIAHEFGHFAQRSMKTGSYVYHANQVIHNMLYENRTFDDMLNRWANMHFLFSICAKITSQIVSSIQAVLGVAYKVVNKHYLRLSREMEFGADAMSVKASGVNNAIHALRRIEFADACYNSVIRQYNDWVCQSRKGANLYTHQRIAARFIAEDLGLKLAGGLPRLDDADKHYNRFNRVSVADQWASHPTRQQREEAMKKLSVEAEVVEDSAWLLFQNPKGLQEQFTDLLYESVIFSTRPDVVEDDTFAGLYEAAMYRYNLPAVYAGYYNRVISRFDPDIPVEFADPVDDIVAFFAAHADIPRRIDAVREDIWQLEQIGISSNGIRTFDFDGSKFERSQYGEIKSILEADLAELEASLRRCDRQVYSYYRWQSGGKSDKGELIRDLYCQYFEAQELQVGFIAACNEIIALIEPFYQDQPLVHVEAMNIELQGACRVFGEKMREAEAAYGNNPLTVHVAIPGSLIGFDEREWQFLTEERFNSNQLTELEEVIRLFSEWIYETGFAAQKSLLVAQADTEASRIFASVT